jgi:hypothetical protein
VLALTGDHVLDLDANADLERRGADVVHACLHRDEIAHVDRMQERHLVHRDRHAHPTGVLDRRDAGGGVDELHHLAAVHDPGDVRVRDLHQLDECRLRFRAPLRRGPPRA